MTKTRLALGLLGLAALLAVVAVLGVDALAHSALERTLRDTFGTGARVTSVDVGLLSGAVRAEGLVVANPAPSGGSEFHSPHFASLTRARMTAGLRELLGDTAVVRRVELEEFEIQLERAGGGTNFGPILERLRAASEVEEPAEVTHYRIGELVLRDVSARVRIGPGGSEGPAVTIPEIRIADLGSGPGGAVPLSEVASTALGAALRAVLERSGGLGGLARTLGTELGPLGDRIGDLEIPRAGQGGNGVEDEVRERLEKVLPGGG